MRLKNKDIIYAVVRKDSSPAQDVVCCFAGSLERAERLCDEYTQAFSDSGGSIEDSYYYVVSNVFYTE